MRAADLNDALDAVSAGFDEVAADIAAGVAGSVSSTSSSSVAIGTGSKSFTAQSGRSWTVGQWVIAVNTGTPANFMVGQITAYNSTTGALTISVASGDTGGSGTIAAWTINLIGRTGLAGSNGSNAPGGLVLLGTQTASASASLNFTGLITSTYDEYVLKFFELVPSASSINLMLRTSTDGGASYDAGASDYSWAYGSIRSDSATPSGVVDDADTSIVLEGGGGASNVASAGGWSGEVRIHNPLGTSSNKRVEYDVSVVNVTTGYITRLHGAGQRKSTADIDAIRLLPASGTLTSGTARLYGVNKS